MANDSNQKMKELTDRLETGIKELFSSEKYRSYLQTMSRFHNYSAKNVALIHLQMPNSTKVAGFTTWKKDFDRHVVKGAKGIKIFAPAHVKTKQEMEKIDPDTKKPIIAPDGETVKEEVEVIIPRFKIVTVFDVSMTEGKPLPELVEDLTGDVRQFDLFMDTLRDISPLPIAFEAMPENQDGYCRYGDKIGIREGMSEVQTISAVVHELAHAFLHDKDALAASTPDAPPKNKQTREIEAESVSYAVCQNYGIETSPNSFGYLLSWSANRTLPELKASLETIRQASAALIDGIDMRFHSLAKERGMDLEVDIPVPEASQPNIALESAAVAGGDLETRPNDAVTIDSSMSVAQAAQTSMPSEEMPTLTENSDEESFVWPEVAPSVNIPREPEYDDILPDPAIGLSERDMFGYNGANMLPLLQDRALELFDQDVTVYMLKSDNTEEMAFERNEIAGHDGLFGVEASEWMTSQDYIDTRIATEAIVAERENQLESKLIHSSDDTYGIYQLKDGDDLHYHRFASMKDVKRDDLSIDRANYTLVYTAPLEKTETLDSLFQKFNIDQPPDFSGHSLSVSDVLVLNRGGEISSNYVDSVGFATLSSFLGNESHLHDDIEYGPAVTEIEVRVKQGQSISLIDLSKAIKSDAEAARENQSAQKPLMKLAAESMHSEMLGIKQNDQKPSILAQLKEAKNTAAQGRESGVPTSENSRMETR